MAYKAQSSDNFGASDTGNVVLTVPASAVEGDLMVAIILTADDNPDETVTPPATESWTVRDARFDPTGATSPPASFVYSKVVSADDEANAGSKTYTWQLNQAIPHAGVLLLYDPADWGQYAENVQTGTGTDATAPAVTTTSNNEIVVFCVFKDGGTSGQITPPGAEGDTTRFNDVWGATTDAGADFAIVERTQASPGSSGTKTFTISLNERSGFTFSLEPLQVPHEQEGFRWRDDDGSESGASWLAAQDTNISRGKETNTRLRILTDTDGSGDPMAVQLVLQYKRDDEPDTEWRNV